MFWMFSNGANGCVSLEVFVFSVSLGGNLGDWNI